MAYKVSLPFNVPLRLLIPTVTKINGVNKKEYPPIESGELFYGSFKTYGGTEKQSNGVLMIEDTATIETFYRPEIKSDCAVAIADTGEIYEVISPPENIGMKYQYLVFKVRRVKGGA